MFRSIAPRAQSGLCFRRAASTLARVAVQKNVISAAQPVLARVAVQPRMPVLRATAASRFFHRSSMTADEFKVVNTPHMADSITEGELARWTKHIGDFVNRDDVVAVIETDKVDIEVNAPESGTLVERFAEEGAKVVVATPLFKLKLGGAAAAPAPAAAPKPQAAPAPKKEAAPAAPKAEAPKAPAAAEPPKAAAAPTAPKKETPAPEVAKPAEAGQRTERRVKMTRMRLSIAERLKEAQNTNAMLTTFNEIDMSNISALRNQFKDDFLEKHKVKLGFMSAFVKASVVALQDQPVVNAVIEGQEIIYRDYIDISVAVATPKGLVVPVLRNCEKMSFADVEKSIAALGAKARTNDIAIEDMIGGTFTISNGGVYGSLMGTPIINPPQAAILGMHGIFDRPVAINGKVEIRPMMYVALTYDHRLIDGREAVTFLRKIKAVIEDPRRLLVDL
eukprot:Opistho-2@43120